MKLSNNFIPTGKVPKLTLPKEVSDHLFSLLKKMPLDVLEYGSGGSSLIFAKHAKTLITCDTDSAFLLNLIIHLTSLECSATIHPIHQDVGPVAKWGHPKDPSLFSKFLETVNKPWLVAEKHKINPNLIFIDGRFRIASFVLSLLKLSSQTSNSLRLGHNSTFISR
jgi:hypothetical protein